MRWRGLGEGNPWKGEGEGGGRVWGEGVKWRIRGRSGLGEENPWKGGDVCGEGGEGLCVEGRGVDCNCGGLGVGEVLMFGSSSSSSPFLVRLLSRVEVEGGRVALLCRELGASLPSPRRRLARCWRWTAAQARKVRSMHLLTCSCTTSLAFPTAE